MGTLDSKLTLSDPTSPQISSRVRRLKWSIFEIAYEAPRPRGFSSLQTALFQFRVLAVDGRTRASVWLFRQLFNMAPVAVTIYFASLLWMSLAPAFSLCMGHRVLSLVQAGLSGDWLAEEARPLLQSLVVTWLSIPLITALVEKVIDDEKHIIGGYLRRHFLPRMAEASLSMDMSYLQEHEARASLPQPWAFGEITPGWDFVYEFSTRIQNIITLFAEIFVLIRIITQTGSPDAEILSTLCVLFLGVMFLAPSNGVGGAGYTFWTTNKHYHRLGTLYTMIFDENYRQTIAKDGLSSYLQTEFKDTSDSLGVVRANTLNLACYLQPPWYWSFMRSLIIDYPMALYALFLSFSSFPASLLKMVLFQYITCTLKQSIDCLRGAGDPAPLWDIMIKAEKLFKVIQSNSRILKPTRTYPDPVLSSNKGMKISMKNVSFHYPGCQNHPSVCNVSLTIEPGQLVVLVGVNGSGKTSLLKLIAGLSCACGGEIEIDDHPVHEYDSRHLRRSMAFMTSSEDIYPVSLRENILMGLDDCGFELSDVAEKIEEAARLGGAYDVVQRLGQDAILNPCRVLGQSLRGCGNGEIGDAALRELDLHSPALSNITISAGERQRIIASRTFMRVKHGDVKLVILDEPTSALDSMAERDFFKRFREIGNGKTMIFVTHRFGSIVKNADMILCIDGGKVVQQGTHAELIEKNGRYAELYNVQAAAFSSS